MRTGALGAGLLVETGRVVRRWGVAIALTCTVLATLAPPAGADGVDPGAESEFVARTNDLRAGLGLPALEVDAELTAKARAWAQTMADAGQIGHSHLPDGVGANWRRLGENVGMGPTAIAIHEALVASPSHYENLADPGFRFVGVGVVSTGETIFVSEVFMELASQPAPSTPPPAAGTPTSLPEVEAAPTPPVPEPAPASPAPAPGPTPQLSLVLSRLHELDE